MWVEKKSLGARASITRPQRERERSARMVKDGEIRARRPRVIVIGALKIDHAPLSHNRETESVHSSTELGMHVYVSPVGQTPSFGLKGRRAAELEFDSCVTSARASEEEVELAAR